MGGSIILNILSAKEREDGVTKSENAANGGRHWKRDKSAKTNPQKIQPHAPTGNCFRKRHLTLSLKVENLLAELPV